MRNSLDPLFNPNSVVFIGGSNLSSALKYHRDLGFAGHTWIVNPKHKEIEGFECFASIDALPLAPDLAFVAVRRELAIEAVRALRNKNCKAVICNAAGFSETGNDGSDLQSQLTDVTGDMVLLGPNAVGVINFENPMAAIMDQFGVAKVTEGVAIVSQGGGLLCDVVFSDRGLAVTHMAGCGNQATTGVEACVNYLLDNPRVKGVGICFEGLRDVSELRLAAAKALGLGKPLVAYKLGKTDMGAQASASHTASLTGAGAAWEALFDRLGIISVNSMSEFIEVLKLVNADQMPKGRRVMVTSASGSTGVFLADHLSEAGFNLCQPTGQRFDDLRALLPRIATPCNPQDITMAAWTDKDNQRAIYEALLGEGYDIAVLGQNYPREGMWDLSEYVAPVEAFGEACHGFDVTRVLLAPLADCMPDHAHAHAKELGLVAMQGLEDCVSALRLACWWSERRAELLANGGALTIDAPSETSNTGRYIDEAEAKSFLSASGITVADFVVSTRETAAKDADRIGFPVVIKALDPRIQHKTEVGAVQVNLDSTEAVSKAVDQMLRDMAAHIPDVPLSRLLIEKMSTDVVVEILASVTFDPAVGPLMMIAGGGIEAELWNDSVLLAAPFDNDEISRKLDVLKSSKRLDGWRGGSRGDRDALLRMLSAIADLSFKPEIEEVEINPILVGRTGAVAVDAVIKLVHDVSDSNQPETL